MAKTAGRDCTVRQGATTIAGGRTTGITCNGEPIDVTDQGDSGVQNFLSNVLASDTCEITIDGLEEDSILHDLAFSGVQSDKFISDLGFFFANGDSVVGGFVMTNYTTTGEYQEATKFNATFVRNGAHTFTQA